MREMKIVLAGYVAISLIRMLSIPDSIPYNLAQVFAMSSIYYLLTECDGRIMKY